MDVGEKNKRVYNPKRYTRPVELPRRKEKEREKVEVPKREKVVEDSNAS